MITGNWNHPAVIQPNNFIYKSLSNWACNIAVGCTHGCTWCFVPSVSTNKMVDKLKPLGVSNPDSDWGDFVFLRKWNEASFLTSVKKAERTEVGDLKVDGNRAVIFCSTTDPYQTIRNQDAKTQLELNERRRNMVRRAMEIIRDESTLNIRILTRSPLARNDFDVMKTLGNRMMFGMSLPTLRNDIAKIYEPKAPAPTQRLATLKAAKEAGINVYVAMAPTYPECDAEDMNNTLVALRELDPMTIFHEPVNIRAENVERIRKHALSIGYVPKLEVFATTETWRDYAVHQLMHVEEIAHYMGLKQLHLWPDASLGAYVAVQQAQRGGRVRHLEWLQKWWNRISEWPKVEKKQFELV